MKTLTALFGACALSLGMIGAAQAQAENGDHAVHHSAQSAATEPAAAPSKAQMTPGAGMMKNMEAHMQAMGGMHQQMAERMKSMPADAAGMQDCRQMMGSMMNPAS